MSIKKYFQFRAFVSLLTGFSFLVALASGIILYITPQGRIANWTNWTFWELTKHEWIALHICFNALFAIASTLHIWLNWKAILSYFSGKLQHVSRFRIEWLMALIICVAVYWGALKPFAPFSSLLDLNQRIKLSWATPKKAPPIPHAELFTVEELAKEADVDLETILANLRSKNIEAARTDVFGQIAEQAGLSPDELYQIAIGHLQKERQGGQRRGGEKGGAGGGGSGGGGFGQKTLKQVCQEMNISSQEAVDILNTAGISASADETIRTIADKNNIHPSEIRQLLGTQ